MPRPGPLQRRSADSTCSSSRRSKQKAERTERLRTAIKARASAHLEHYPGAGSASALQCLGLLRWSRSRGQKIYSRPPRGGISSLPGGWAAAHRGGGATKMRMGRQRHFYGLNHLHYPTTRTCRCARPFDRRLISSLDPWPWSSFRFDYRRDPFLLAMDPVPLIS